MLTLQSIKGMDEAALELLEAAGWTDPRQLATADADEVAAEMVKANGFLRLVRKVPGREAVARWIDEARELTGIRPDDGSLVTLKERAVQVAEEIPEEVGEEVAEERKVVREPVDFEADPEIRAMIDGSPLAIPIPNRVLAERGIAPGEISIAAVLTRAAGDLEIRSKAAPRKPVPMPKPQVADVRSGTPQARSRVVTLAETAAPEPRAIDNKRVRTIEDAKSDPAPKRRVQVDERLALLRSAREKTNRGKNPNSKRFIRGVLHDRPYLVWFGCVIVLAIQAVVPVAVVAAALLILSELLPIRFGWAPDWIIVFPVALPVLGLLYLLVSIKVKCRVCGQRLLVPRYCLKNRKAHHVPGLGYVMPLAVHTLFFRWFNCTFCGTSVRIKE